MHVMSALPDMTYAECLKLHDLCIAVSTGCEALASIINITPGVEFDEPNLTGIRDTPIEWHEAARSVVERLRESDTAVLTAATGTGKSLFFPSALLGKTINGVRVRRVVILQPRNVNCEGIVRQPGSIWLKAGVVYDNSPIVTCTYGYAFAACSGSDMTALSCPLDANTVVLFDEAHEPLGEREWLFRAIQAKKVVQTATPVDWMSAYPVVHCALDRPYKQVRVEAFGHCPVEIAVTLARKDWAGRMLLIFPTIREARKAVSRMAVEGLKAVEYSRQMRVVPDDENTHICATSVVDAGANVPGVSVVIDSGVQFTNDAGQMTRLNVTKATAEQRKGRGGRMRNGLTFVCARPSDVLLRAPMGVDAALAKSPLAAVLNVRSELDANTDPSCSLYANSYAFVEEWDDPRDKSMVSFYYGLLVQNGFDTRAVFTEWKRTQDGYLPQSVEYLAKECHVVLGALNDCSVAEAAYQKAQLHYRVGGRHVIGKPYVVDYRLKCGSSPKTRRLDVAEQPQPFVDEHDQTVVTYTEILKRYANLATRAEKGVSETALSIGPIGLSA